MSIIICNVAVYIRLLIIEMPKQLLNSTLPFEILKIIFQNLFKKPLNPCYNFKQEFWTESLGEPKTDLKTCLSVCKSWRKAAEDLFGKMSITVYEDSLERLSRDLVHFSQKVRAISLLQSESIDRAVTCLIWYNIILACPNLAWIGVNIHDDSKYVRCLMDTPSERLGHIQHFAVCTQKLHLDLNLKYCKTVTSLYIPSLVSFCGNESFSELVRFISLFPKVVSFSLVMRFCPKDFVDIIQFLEAAPQLQFLEVNHFNKLKSASRTTSMDLCLNELVLGVDFIDVNSLIFITSGLPKLNRLFMTVRYSVTDLPQDRFGTQMYNAEVVFEYMKEVTSKMAYFSIIYKIGDKIYTLQNDNEPQIFQADEDISDALYGYVYDENTGERIHELIDDSVNFL
ncbi:hypothetical protein BD770DRAFT_411254 [Pilaira anomala]|nr:hypothetical protein BD770DRAFT_411254 [Pilaira anomala]